MQRARLLALKGYSDFCVGGFRSVENVAIVWRMRMGMGIKTRIKDKDQGTARQGKARQRQQEQ